MGLSRRVSECRERRTVTLESGRSTCAGDDSCAALEATPNAMTAQANHIRFRDDTCRLLTIQKLKPEIKR